MVNFERSWARNVRVHPTKTCPHHPDEHLWYTTSRKELVCTASYDCPYVEQVEVEIPKAVARAIRRLRKRTRRMLRRKARSENG